MAAAKFCAVFVAVVIVRLPFAGDGCGKEPAAVLAAFRERGGRMVRGGAECGRVFLQPDGGALACVEHLPLGGEFGKYQDAFAGFVDGIQQEVRNRRIEKIT